MPKRSAAAEARRDQVKLDLDAELANYQSLIRGLHASSASTLERTHKQREYHQRIGEIQSKLDRLRIH